MQMQHHIAEIGQLSIALFALLGILSEIAFEVF